MRSESIARNYAEALFTLGERSGRTGEYGDLLEALAGGMKASPKVMAVFLSPKVPKAVKNRLLADAMPEAPGEFVLFLQAVVKRGRQVLIGEIFGAYLGLLDLKHDRVRAGVTVARVPDEALKARITKALKAGLKKEVLPTFIVDPEILGGVIVRVGDRVMDGSVKRRMTRLRRQLLK